MTLLTIFDNEVTMFEATILPVVERHARQVFRKNDELVSIALVLAWWIWANRRQDWPATVYAQLAVRNARSGRDLPGVKTRSGDIWDKGSNWGGGGMAGVRDRRPDPLTALILKEEVEGLTEGLTEVETALVEAIMEEGIYRTDALAEHLEVSQGRVSQLKRQVAQKKK